LSEYRPLLSIRSVVIRHLHKIIAKRLSTLDIFDKRQNGFRPVYGIYENVKILSTVFGDARRQYRSLHMACVNLSKEPISKEPMFDRIDQAYDFNTNNIIEIRDSQLVREDKIIIFVTEDGKLCDDNWHLLAKDNRISNK